MLPPVAARSAEGAAGRVHFRRARHSRRVASFAAGRRRQRPRVRLRPGSVCVSASCRLTAGKESLLHWDCLPGEASWLTLQRECGGAKEDEVRERPFEVTADALRTRRVWCSLVRSGHVESEQRGCRSDLDVSRSWRLASCPCPKSSNGAAVQRGCLLLPRGRECARVRVSRPLEYEHDRRGAAEVKEEERVCVRV